MARNYLKQLRIKNKMSQNEVASTLGMTQQNYHLIESGAKKDLNVDLICKISNTFDISIDEIIKMESQYKDN